MDETDLQGPTLFGTVEVDDMDGTCALALPLPSAPYGICIVLLLAVEVPLPESYAPAVPKVYGRENREALQRLRAHKRKFS
jgi:hypothetical protein